jgi:DNA-3-methyladenine glycosylase II
MTPADGGKRLLFSYRPRGPFSLERTAARFLRFPEAVDRFDGGIYRRLLPAGGGVALVAVGQSGSSRQAVLDVEVRFRGAERGQARAAGLRVVERTLGAGEDIRPFYRALSGDRWLADPLRRFRGLRVAGTASLWESLATAVLCQQINLRFAYSIRRELSLALGRQARFGDERYVAFPTPQAILRAAPSLPAFRLSRSKARALSALARAFVEGALEEEEIAGLPEEEAILRMTRYPGVGRWTAEIALLRGLGRVDAFPAADLGVVRYLAEGILRRDGKQSERQMRAFAERWRPYRGLALVYAYAELERLKSERKKQTQ